MTLPRPAKCPQWVRGGAAGRIPVSSCHFNTSLVPVLYGHIYRGCPFFFASLRMASVFIKKSTNQVFPAQTGCRFHSVPRISLCLLLQC
ncbi:Uncharacterized protein HZ326_16762 [Fusarium oxysporum f. sp. albedinis]|nr:Uncharacterized protein HZ326_16762 [Fusarium oxysporum f. sp. albedinis]